MRFTSNSVIEIEEHMNRLISQVNSGFRRIENENLYRISGGIIVTGSRPKAPDFGGLDPLVLMDLRAEQAMQDAISNLEFAQSLESAPEDDETENCQDPLELIDREDSDGVDPAMADRFDANKSTLAASLFALGATFSGTVGVAGDSQSIDIESQDFGEFLDDYDFIWNSSFNSDYGDGASFEEFAIVNPATLSAGDFSPETVAMSFPDSGGNFGVAIWNWVTLHEAVHQYVIDAGIQEALHAEWWNNGEPATSWPESSQFAANEQITNDLVRAIGTALGIELPDELRGGEGAMAVSTTTSEAGGGNAQSENSSEDSGNHCPNSQ